MKLNIEIPYTEFKWLQEENLIISLPSLIYACKWVSERYKTPENQMTVRKLQVFRFPSQGSSEIFENVSQIVPSSYQVIHFD